MMDWKEEFCIYDLRFLIGDGIITDRKATNYLRKFIRIERKLESKQLDSQRKRKREYASQALALAFSAHLSAVRFDDRLND